MSTHIVITTIQGPTKSVRKLVEVNGDTGSSFIIIGDKKGPFAYSLGGTDLYSLERQQALRYSLAEQLPTGHYSRKNIGYLVAIATDADCIYETDDDNAPLDNWVHRQKRVSAHEIQQTGWVNIFRAYSDELIWPRGFPLCEIQRSISHKMHFSSDYRAIDAPIQQGLAEGSPDVDAVWRLTHDKEVRFNGDHSYYLPAGAWCPFNSQSTWWWPEAYPLLYLPSFCSFRMTDIWRGFIAQRCLWAMGYNLVFHPPEVFQERNAHDLMKDFSDEIVGYQRNHEMINILTDIELDGNKCDAGSNMLKCYEILTKEGFFDNNELTLVNAWLSDLNMIQSEINKVEVAR